MSDARLPHAHLRDVTVEDRIDVALALFSRDDVAILQRLVSHALTAHVIVAGMASFLREVALGLGHAFVVRKENVGGCTSIVVEDECSPARVLVVLPWVRTSASEQDVTACGITSNGCGIHLDHAILCLTQINLQPNATRERHEDVAHLPIGVLHV